jgi:NAD(P)-dependent dehydrogenase (short-subunit alcohol dehydrogenase family)
MDELSGRGAFITGGANGFGLALARLLHAEGMRVAIADVRADALDAAVASFTEGRDRVFPFVVDVSDRERMAEVADQAERALGRVHLLCNNAGIGVTGPIKDATFDDWDWMLGVLLGGVVNGVQLFLPKLRAHGEGGHILNTASMSGVVASPDSGIYVTAKFAVVGLSESLRGELAADGIGVSVFLAGPMDTRFMWTHELRPEDKKTGYAEHDRRRERVAQVLARSSPERKSFLMTPDEAARRVLRGLRRNDLYIITHPEFGVGLRARGDALLRAIPAEPVVAERAQAMAPLTSNAIYAGQQTVPAFDRAARGKDE